MNTMKPSYSVSLTLQDCTCSDHFRQRQAQRSISDDAIALALRFGEVFFQGGDRVYFLGRKQIPPDIPAILLERYDGTTVVVGCDNVLVTTYRNRDGRKLLKRRSHGSRSQGFSYLN